MTPDEAAREEIGKNARIASSIACALGSGRGLEWSTVTTIAGIIESLWTDQEALEDRLATAQAEMDLIRRSASISDFKEIATVHFVDAILGLIRVVKDGGTPRLLGSNLFVTPKLEILDAGYCESEMQNGQNNEERNGSPGSVYSSNHSDAADEERGNVAPSFSMSLTTNGAIDLPSTSTGPGIEGIDLSALFAPRSLFGLRKRPSAPLGNTPDKKPKSAKKSHMKGKGGPNSATHKAVDIPATSSRGGPLLPNGKRQWNCPVPTCTVHYDNLGGLVWHVTAKHWIEGDFIACCLNCDKRLSFGRACKHAKTPACETANFAYWFEETMTEEQKRVILRLEAKLLGECPFDYCESKMETLSALYDHARCTHRSAGRLMFECAACGMTMCKPAQLLKHAVKECNLSDVITRISSLNGLDESTLVEEEGTVE